MSHLRMYHQSILKFCTKMVESMSDTIQIGKEVDVEQMLLDMTLCSSVEGMFQVQCREGASCVAYYCHSFLAK